MQPDKVPFGRKTAVSSSLRPGRGIAAKPPSRAVEGLARKLYEAGNPNGVPWVRCGWTVREAWLSQALQQHDEGTRRFEWLFPWRRHGALAALATLALLPFGQSAGVAEPSIFQFEVQAVHIALRTRLSGSARRPGFYLFNSARWYGCTKDGFFVCQIEGDKAGYKAMKS